MIPSYTPFQNDVLQDAAGHGGNCRNAREAIASHTLEQLLSRPGIAKLVYRAAGINILPAPRSSHRTVHWPPYLACSCRPTPNERSASRTTQKHGDWHPDQKLPSGGHLTFEETPTFTPNELARFLHPCRWAEITTSCLDVERHTPHGLIHDDLPIH